MVFIHQLWTFTSHLKYNLIIKSNIPWGKCQDKHWQLLKHTELVPSNDVRKRGHVFAAQEQGVACRFVTWHCSRLLSHFFHWSHGSQELLYLHGKHICDVIRQTSFPFSPVASVWTEDIHLWDCFQSGECQTKAGRPARCRCSSSWGHCSISSLHTHGEILKKIAVTNSNETVPTAAMWLKFFSAGFCSILWVLRNINAVFLFDMLAVFSHSLAMGDPHLPHTSM